MDHGVCILLVEDDRVLGPLTREALAMLGHRSVLATNAMSVYDALSRQHTFDVVLLDLELGSERSEPVIQKLRQEGWDLPHILITSAQPLLEIRRSIQLVGAKGYLQKPVTMHEIDRAIDVAVA